MGSRASVGRTTVGIQVPSRNVLRVESIEDRSFSPLPPGDFTPLPSEQVDVNPLRQIVDDANFTPIVERQIRVRERLSSSSWRSSLVVLVDRQWSFVFLGRGDCRSTR